MYLLLSQARAALRLSDKERERLLERLKRHYTEGRLSAEELERGVEHVYRSTTRAQLGTFLYELPMFGLRQLIGFRIRRVQRTVLRAHFAVFATLNATVIGIWALTGEGSFWPAWLLLPTSALLAWHTAISRTVTRALSRRGL